MTIFKNVVLLSTVMAAQAAFSATINTADDIKPESLKHIFGSKYVMQKMYEIGSHYEIALERNKNCESKVDIVPISLGILKPIVYDASAEYPESGSWSSRFKLTRCENSSVYNVLFVAVSNAPPKAYALYPGESQADPLLYMDTVKSAVPLIEAAYPEAVKECKVDSKYPLYLADTKIAKKNKDGSWQEAWTFKVCSQLKSVSVDFTPDDKGTKFSIKPLK